MRHADGQIVFFNIESGVDVVPQLAPANRSLAIPRKSDITRDRHFMRAYTPHH